METLSPFQAAWYPRILGIVRIVLGYLVIAHGTAKLLKVPHVAMFDQLQPWSLPWIAGCLELVGGALLILGFLTRPTAFVLSGLMAFAYFIGHASKGSPLLPLLNGGELAVVYCFLFLFLALAGGGAFGIDSILKRRNP